MTFVMMLVGALFGVLISAILIWIIGKLGWGMEVSGFGAAFLAAILFGLFSVVINAVLNLVGLSPERAWVAILVHLVASVVALLLASGLVKGLRVKGFLGGLVAVVGMSAVGALVNWLVQLIF